MSALLRKLNEERQSLWAQMQEIRSTARDDGGRDLTPEESARWDKLESDLAARSEGIEREQRAIETERRLAEPVREARMLPGQEPKEGRGGKPKRIDATDEYRDAFVDMVRYGVGNLSPEARSLVASGFRMNDDTEQRALTVTTTAGGYLIPQGFYDQLTKARLQFGGVRQSRARVFQTETGAPLPIPAMNDTGNKGVLLAINTQMANQDVAFTTRSLGAYVMHSKAVLVPWQLLQDSAFDIEDLLASAFGERIGRIENDYFTTGSGSSEPQGIVTGAAAGATAGSATVVAFADLLALFHSVDPAYREMAEWMMNDTTVAQLRTLEDDNGRPLWLPASTGSLQDGEPDRILGKPLVINQSMASPATATIPIVFGDMSSFWIREVRGITMVRLEERYADYLQTGFFAYERVDSIVVNAGTNPIKKLTMA